MKNLQVTIAELTDILLATQVVKGMPMFASVLQETQPKALVKSRINKDIKNPFDTIIKRSQVSILLNGEYETAVLNRLAKEDKEATDYKKGANTMPLEFGNNNQFIGMFNGKAVLQYRPNPNESTKPKTTYFANGVEVDKKEVENFLPLPSQATNQGTDLEILWRKLYLTNVVELTFNGTKYEIIK